MKTYIHIVILAFLTLTSLGQAAGTQEIQEEKYGLQTLFSKLWQRIPENVKKCSFEDKEFRFGLADPDAGDFGVTVLPFVKSLPHFSKGQIDTFSPEALGLKGQSIEAYLEQLSQKSITKLQDKEIDFIFVSYNGVICGGAYVHLFSQERTLKLTQLLIDRDKLPTSTIIAPLCKHIITALENKAFTQTYDQFVTSARTCVLTLTGLIQGLGFKPTEPDPKFYDLEEQPRDYFSYYVRQVHQS